MNGSGGLIDGGLIWILLCFFCFDYMALTRPSNWLQGIFGSCTKRAEEILYVRVRDQSLLPYVTVRVHECHMCVCALINVPANELRIL